jgi:hypothetical protein
MAISLQNHGKAFVQNFFPDCSLFALLAWQADLSEIKSAKNRTAVAHN